MYVVFTDYTGKAEKEVTKERREKDPMLFGTFQKPRTDTRNGGVVLNDRFYFLGDWEDEYWDLTMDKFLKEVGKEKLQTVVIPTNTDEIKEELETLLNQENKTKTEIAIEIMLSLMRRQIFIDGNKRASVIFANQYLIAHGQGLLVIPEKEVPDFKKLLVKYYEGEDISVINEFLKEKCWKTF